MALRQRLDKWLWFARVARTRSLAARLVAEGHVRLNARRIETPAKGVGPGDVLTIALERHVRVLRSWLPAAPGRLYRSFSLVRGIAGTRRLSLARPCQWSYLNTYHSPDSAAEASGFLQKSCKIPWTIWTNSAKTIHPHGLDRSAALRASSRCRAGEGAFLESLGKIVILWRSMAPFSTSRYVNGIASRTGNCFR